MERAQTALGSREQVEGLRLKLMRNAHLGETLDR
jgi:hypothetical protein